MKRLTLLLSALAIAVGVFASNGDNKVKVKSEAESKIAVLQGKEVVKLVYLNEGESRVNISLYNKKGEQLLSTNIKSNQGFIQPFNFSNLTEGKYTFEISDESGTILEDITYTRKEIIKSAVYNITDSRKFKVNVLAEGETVKIKIVDKDDNLIYSEKLEGAESFSKIYDLSEAGQRDYIFKVTTGDHTDYHSAKL